MARGLLQLILFLCVLVGSVSFAAADYYKYTDSSGAVNITNKLDSVPQKYRSKVKVVTDDTLAKKDAGARQQQQAEPVQEETSAPKQVVAPAPAAAPEGKIAELSARYPWFKPLLYVVGILFAFLAVIKLVDHVPSPQLAKLIYISFFIGVFVLIYKAYVEHVVADTMAVKEKAVTMMKKANEREILPDDAPGAPKK